MLTKEVELEIFKRWVALRVISIVQLQSEVTISYLLKIIDRVLPTTDLHKEIVLENIKLLTMDYIKDLVKSELNSSDAPFLWSISENEGDVTLTSARAFKGLRLN